MNTSFCGNPFADSAALTLQHMLDRVATDPGVTERQKREISSAVNSTARWLHRTLAEIPANHAFLERAYSRLNFGAVGATRSRFRNVRSLVKQGLSLVGVGNSGRSYLAEIDPIWNTLREKIPDQRTKECLGRLFRYCSTQGVTPEQVTDRTIQEFQESLVREGVTARPEVAAQSAVRIWNRLTAQVDGWPMQRLYASTCSAISLATRGSVFIRKWVAPMRALIVPKGCSTVSRR
jgi:hypothetical protein